MWVKAKVLCECRVAHDHASLGAGLAKSGHGVAEAFDVVGQEGFELRAQIARGALEGRGEAAEVGFDVH